LVGAGIPVPTRGDAGITVGFDFSDVAFGNDAAGLSAGLEVADGVVGVLPTLRLGESSLQFTIDKHITMLKNKTFVFLNIFRIAICF
jgi:hypothetical protein